MNIISPVRSLMNFNLRVLAQGTPKSLDTIDNLAELNDLLFFNTIFQSNMDEVFRKYSMTEFADEYAEMCYQRIDNIDKLIQRFCMIQGYEIKSDACLEARLAIEDYAGVIDRDIVEADHFLFRLPHMDEDRIYHIVQKSNKIHIWHVNPEALVFSKPIKTYMNDHAVYWKEDAIIRHYMAYALQAVPVTIRITKGEYPNVISKVEYTGNPIMMQMIQDNFSKRTVIIKNPYLYTKDIERIFESKVIPYFVHTQFCTNVTFERIFDRDLLIEYPKNSFNEYLQFLASAAQSKSVKDIYLTLYRIGSNPQLFYILRDAVKHGKYVHVNIELYASGESINRMWMNEMRDAGIDVTTFPDPHSKDPKVHCKLTLIRFKKGNMIAQIGTGNYHTKTTSEYTDLSLYTADEEICNEVYKVFQMLHGMSVDFLGESLLVSRFNVYPVLCKYIMEEAEKGENGYIAIKCNAFHTPILSQYLDDAANAGCKIDLIVRGMCTWIPTKINDGVTIRSIIWSKLEHSRVYAFGKDNPTIFMGSLDLVSKKMEERVETLVKIKDPDVMIQVVNYLNSYITNTKDSWIQTETGIYLKERKD